MNVSLAAGEAGGGFVGGAANAADSSTRQHAAGSSRDRRLGRDCARLMARPFENTEVSSSYLAMVTNMAGKDVAGQLYVAGAEGVENLAVLSQAGFPVAAFDTATEAVEENG